MAPEIGFRSESTRDGGRDAGCGISLPALKELIGHRDIRMTLRYLKVTQTDLQRHCCPAIT